MRHVLLFLVSYLFLNTVFADTSDSDDEDSDVQVLYVQKTRFGDVSLVSIDAMPADTIMFNGKKVFEDSAMHVGIAGNYQVKDSDVILLGSNPGGSATPASHMSFLVIKKDGSTQVLSNPDFIEAFDGSSHVTMDKDKQIYVKLGFPIEVGPTRGETEPVAILNSGKLAIIHLSRIHADYRLGPAISIEEYFADDKSIGVRKSYQDSVGSQRVEYFCDDKELMERDPEYYNGTESSHALCAVALFTKQSNRWIFSEQFEIPYGGIVKQFAGNELTVESTEYLDNDGFACPSLKVTRVFKTGSGKLVENVGARKSKTVKKNDFCQ